MGWEAVVNHLANDQKRGVRQLIEVGADRPFAGGAHHGVVLGQASLGHDGHGQVALAKVKQVLGDFAQPPAPHEHDKRRGGAQGLNEVVSQTAVLASCRAEPRGRSHATKRQRDAGQAGKRRPGGDAWYVGPGEAELVGKRQLFSSTSKHHRVAAFQPHDAQALPRPFFNPIVDQGLGSAGLASTLAHTNFYGLSRRKRHDVLVHKAVVEHEFGLFECARALERQQLGVARSGAYQPEVGLTRLEIQRCGHVKMLLRNWQGQTRRRGRSKTHPPS